MTNSRLPVDLLDPYFYVGDVHPAFDWMRRNEPVYRDEKNAMWGIARMADLREAERRDDLFSSKGAFRVLVNPEEKTMISQDDPEHLEQRQLISKRFTPRRVEAKVEDVRATVTNLLDAFIERGSLEVVDELAGQLPARLTATMMGFDESQWRAVKSWSERLMRLDVFDKRPELLADGIAAVEEYARDLVVRVPERRRCPADDIISEWAASDRMSMEHMIDETGLMVSGGAETTRTTIARGLLAFCDHNDQWDLLAERPELIESAVEEMLRWVTPLNNMFRRVTADTELGGTRLQAGDRIALLYPSANRDEDVFDAPYRFDVRRDPNPHIAFGLGTHFCLGASFARMTLRTLLQELVPRIRNLRVTNEPVYEPNIFVKAVVSAGISFDLR